MMADKERRNDRTHQKSANATNTGLNFCLTAKNLTSKPVKIIVSIFKSVKRYITRDPVGCNVFEAKTKIG